MAGSSNSKRRSLRVTILSAFLILLVITVAPIVIYNFYRTSSALYDLTHNLIGEAAATVIEQTTGYLAPATAMAGMSARLGDLHGEALPRNEALERYAIEVLHSWPQLAMFNLADEQGNFVMPKKLPDGTIATKIVDRNVSPPTVTWKYRNTEGAVVRTETSEDVQYDPRTRPWYQGAVASGGSYWTDMYILFTDQVPGITTAAPIRDANGAITGVLGLDIELGEMSAFLRSLRLGESGAAFVINEKDEVVAFPDEARLVTERDGKLAAVQITDLGVPKVVTAYREHLQRGEDRFRFRCEGDRYLGAIIPFPASFGRPWRIGVVVAERDFVGAMNETLKVSLFFSLVVLLIASFSARRIANGIARPIVQLSEEAKKIQDFDLEGGIRRGSVIHEIQMLTTALDSMKAGLQAFGKYVPTALVRQLIQTGNAARLGGEKRELTVFFSDIAGFTAISERLDPEELMNHLSRYLDVMTETIIDEEGTVDKYIGDAVMAFWGAPVPDEDHVAHACAAALRCIAAIDAMNRDWEAAGLAALHTRIGIHTGETVVGNVGSQRRMNYTVLGDSVNLASRLEGANKAYGTNILVSEDTYTRICDRFLLRPVDRVGVKGREQGVLVYELLGLPEDPRAEEWREWQVLSERALDAYYARRWDEALERFRELQALLPEDKATALHIERCLVFVKHPPGPGWTGVTRMTSK